MRGVRELWRKIVAGPVAVWGGIRWAAGGAASAVRGGLSRAWDAIRGQATGRSRIRGVAARLWERSGGRALAERARSSPAVSVAIAAGAILACAWIGWTIYVAAENGTMAGLGVLISWPAVLMALAIVASPFVATAVLIRRRRGGEGGAPPIAGGAEVEAPENEGSTGGRLG